MSVDLNQLADEIEGLLEKADPEEVRFIKQHDIHGKPIKGLVLRRGGSRMPANFASATEAELYVSLRNNAPTLLASVRERDALVDALEKIRRTPNRPFPDAGAHSWRAFGTAVHSAWVDIQHVARQALTPDAALTGEEE